MDALNTEMAAYAGHVNTVVPFAPPPAAAIPITGNCLEGELRGKTPKERAYLAAQLVSGTLNLVQPTSVQGARLVNTGPGLVHRALGHPVRPPCPADMASYITRFGIERTEQLIAQIKAVAAGEAA
jgi:hypothetical protein